MAAFASKTKTFAVQGMSCGHCEAAIRRSVASLDGVTEAVADAKAGTLTVSGRIDDQAVGEAVRAAGYELER